MLRFTERWLFPPPTTDSFLQKQVPGFDTDPYARLCLGAVLFEEAQSVHVSPTDDPERRKRKIETRDKLVAEVRAYTDPLSLSLSIH